MEKKVFIFLVLSVLFLTNCSTKSDIPNVNNSQNVGNYKVLTEKISESNLNNEKVNFDEVSLDNETLKAKLPCVHNGTSNKVEKEGKVIEETNNFNCKKGNLEFSINVKKSASDLEKEFLKLKDEKSANEQIINGVKAFDHLSSKSKTVTTQVNNGNKDLEEENYSVIKNRVYLINNHQLVSFEISCNSVDKNFCENQLIKNQSTIASEFFDSLKLESN